MTVYISGGDLTSWVNARDKIRSDLWRPGNGLNDDVIDRALHAACLELEGEERWLWLENLTLEFDMTADDDQLVLPFYVRTISALSIIISDNDKELLRVAPLNFVRNASPNDSGIPTYYALGDGIIYFDTIVPAGKQFELIYTAQTPDYLTDAISVANMTIARQQEAVIANACWRIALGFLKDSENAARHRTIYENDLQRLLTREGQQRTDETGGAILPDQSYAADAFGYGGPA